MISSFAQRRQVSGWINFHEIRPRRVNLWNCGFCGPTMPIIALQSCQQGGNTGKGEKFKSIPISVENLKKIVFRASAERVQQVPIYWQIIPFDTKNSFRASAERVQSAPIYWRIIPFIKEAPTDQN